VRLWPALDIRGGRCVRLVHGDFAAETVYGDPEEVAASYLQAGARYLHIVDLDAARTGEPVNRDVIVRIARRSGVSVQVGGGIRSVAAANELLANGVRRVVLGTAALEQPELLASLSAAWPGRIVAGIDHRRAFSGWQVRREVAIRGWLQASATTLEELLVSLAQLDLAAVVVTDISRDGTREGPDVEGLAAALAHTSHPVIASGGVGTAADLTVLAGVTAAGRHLAGVVVGTALLEGSVTIAEADAALAAGASAGATSTPASSPGDGSIPGA
jgi:phosphoribosylformimino-5-aminoimidazole carboxamide ribotide isomerase